MVGLFILGVLKYVVCLCKGCDGCCVCIVTRGAVGARAWEVCVFHHADVICMCLVCILWQFSMLHDLQFVNAGRGRKRRPNGRGILQSRSYW